MDEARNPSLRLASYVMGKFKPQYNGICRKSKRVGRKFKNITK